MAQVFLSVVIPAYNEESRIGPTLLAISRFLERQSWSYEIIVVDDGSTDRTPALVEEWTRANESIRLVRNGENRGKGYSIRHGASEAAGARMLFSDADLSTPIEELSAMSAILDAGDADKLGHSRPVPVRPDPEGDQGHCSGDCGGAPAGIGLTGGLSALRALVWHGVVRPWVESDLHRRFGEPYQEDERSVPGWGPG